MAEMTALARIDDERERLIAEMTPPSLQALVREHGGYGKITPAAWKAFDERKAEWDRRYRAVDFGRAPYAELWAEADRRMDAHARAAPEH